MERRLRYLLKSNPNSPEVKEVKDQINKMREEFGLVRIAGLQPLKDLSYSPTNPNSRFTKDPNELPDPFTGKKVTPNDVQ
jgi:hypothetical protein